MSDYEKMTGDKKISEIEDLVEIDGGEKVLVAFNGQNYVISVDRLINEGHLHSYQDLEDLQALLNIVDAQYQHRKDSTLPTTSKEISGAITEIYNLIPQLNNEELESLKNQLQDLVTQVEDNSSQLEDIVQVNILNFGCDTSKADNAQSFKSLCDYVNEHEEIREVYFPCGVYTYSDGLYFNREIKLKGNATLNYIGNGKAIEFGKRDLTISNYQLVFEIDGLTFTGGINMSHGIFFNKFVVMPRLIDVKFRDFGSENNYNIWFDGDNWDSYLFNLNYHSKTPYKQNFMFVNSRGINSTRIRLRDSLLTNQSEIRGSGVFLDGACCEISHCKIEGFNPNIELSTHSRGTIISNTYFEYADNDSCIIIGDNKGSYIQDITIKDVYCNQHGSDLGCKGSFIKPKSTTTGYQNFVLDNLFITNLDSETPCIIQNNIPSQINNYAYNIKCNSFIHTIGNNISWLGIDKSNCNDLTTKTIKLQNNTDEANYFIIQNGKETNQYQGITFRDINGGEILTIECYGSGSSYIKKNGKAIFYIDEFGLGLGKKSSGQMLEVNGAIGGKHLIFSNKVDANSVYSGSLFIDSSDGLLKYRDFNNNVKTIQTVQ